MKRIIITGGTGFIGANLARRLVQDGHDVHFIVRLGHAKWRIEDIQADIHLHQVDLKEKAALMTVVENIKPDWVFHLAAYGAYPSQFDWSQMMQTNIIGTTNLIEACLKTGFDVFINTGSSSEYGYKNHAPSEKEWLEPNSLYAVTKAFSTQFCRFTAQSKDVRIITLRLYSVYGPYEEPTRLMPSLIVLGLKGMLPPMVSPDNVRDFIYIEDVIDAYLNVASQPDKELGAIFNVGTGIQTSIREVVELVRPLMDIEAEPEWGSMNDRSWDTNIWVADNQKIREELGWRPRYTLKRGFYLMREWFRNNPGMYELYFVRLKEKFNL